MENSCTVNNSEKSRKHAQDHFSAIAQQYAKARISYPAELYEFLCASCSKHDLAWDCATGSGQAAIGLAQFYSRVVATDISEKLLALAPLHPRISYRAAPAEGSGFDSNSVDLITVAQALHWFDLDRFWVEVKRVLRAEGVLAYWGYLWPVVSPSVDRVLGEFRAVIADSWPERSSILHKGYSAVKAQLNEIQCPMLEASAEWLLDDYLNHLRSWSATRYYRDQTGDDVVARFRAAFSHAWKGDCLQVSWPLLLKAYRKT